MISKTKIVDIDVWHNVGIAPLFIAVSVGATVFGLITMQISEKRENASLADDAMHIPGYAEYSSDNEDLMTSAAYNVWSVIFTIYISTFHALVTCIVCTPTQIESIVLSSFAIR